MYIKQGWTRPTGEIEAFFLKNYFIFGILVKILALLFLCACGVCQPLAFKELQKPLLI
jgi:hypothetical protein